MRLPIVSDHYRPVAGPSFSAVLRRHGVEPPVRAELSTLQINVGKRCNQACLHCHVEAGPQRTEVMSREVAQRVIELASTAADLEVVDITGGAPELHPDFRMLVTAFRGLGLRVIDRCNLTVLLEPGMEELPAFLAESSVEVVASLPCYGRDNVDSQRGRGVFDKSVTALSKLNAHGFGVPGTGLTLDLVYNPGGAFLPPPQDKLEEQYRAELRDQCGVEFSRLLTLTNMPIKRFGHALMRQGRYDGYMTLLRDHFNPDTMPALMCRSQVSIGYDGRLYDCDFNQMLELPLAGAPRSSSVWDIRGLSDLKRRSIGTGPHCLGCTAGAGSSCGGALAG
ncbi:MAG: arsenosugar biosynthesis radical SAM protein ArsS, partial [Myxococcales bacterium]|nr:arsenosugar biosynthesis radical SAM protein ArsS [Myxococcales bacterium]MDD9971310.1 arsenosugar biosynthesis radical SAM protein ArsS [Myxococcales bacterium]